MERSATDDHPFRRHIECGRIEDMSTTTTTTPLRRAGTRAFIHAAASVATGALLVVASRGMAPLGEPGGAFTIGVYVALVSAVASAVVGTVRWLGDREPETVSVRRVAPLAVGAPIAVSVAWAAVVATLA
jgi:hypothetical protein